MVLIDGRENLFSVYGQICASALTGAADLGIMSASTKPKIYPVMGCWYQKVKE